VAAVCAATASVALCVAGYAMAISTEDLIVTPAHDELRLSAPRFHFLTGASLAHLHDGISVPYDFQVTLFSGTRDAPVWRGFERFVVSYDLWEERFAVARVTNGRGSSSNLLAADAERWCFGQLAVPTSGLARDGRLWLRLDIRSEDQKDSAPAVGDENGISIASLIEVFSRPALRAQQHWTLENGPFRLAEFQQ